ncbi:MAG: hypothetical protein PHX70_13750 [Clostridium sp.]|nr:hypothetical protein [Clostridium sp.]
MIKRLDTHYTLTQKDIDKINEVAEENGLKPSRSLSKIVSEYREFDLDSLMNILKKISKKDNYILKYINILIQISNSICIKNGLVTKDFVSLDEFTGEFFKAAENEVANKTKQRLVKKYTEGKN